MNTRFVGLFVGGLLLGIVVVWGGLALLPYLNVVRGTWCIYPQCTCTTPNFQAAIYRGPDAGLDLTGEWTVGVSIDGSFFGRLVRRADGAQFKLVGNASGSAINFVIGENPETQEPSRNVYATGTLVHDIRECQGLGLGVLTGPNYGSTGDWGSNYPPYIRIISPHLG